MDEYRVRRIIEERESERSPGIIGCIGTLFMMGFCFWVMSQVGQQFKQLKEDVKVLQEKVDKLEKPLN